MRVCIPEQKVIDPSTANEAQLCLCMWSDLLGFGGPIRAAEWRITPSSAHNLERVSRLHKLTLDSGTDITETVLLINDGVARAYDYVPEHGYMRMFRWLRNTIISHHRLNLIEAENGLPGARTVMAYGERLHYTEPTLSLHQLHGEYGEGYIDRTIVYSPTFFQMNMAFAKAYSLDAAGSASGLSGPCYFIEGSMISFLESLDGQEAPGLWARDKDGKPSIRIYLRKNGLWRELMIALGGMLEMSLLMKSESLALPTLGLEVWELVAVTPMQGQLCYLPIYPHTDIGDGIPTLSLREGFVPGQIGYAHN